MTGRWSWFPFLLALMLALVPLSQPLDPKQDETRVVISRLPQEFLLMRTVIHALGCLIGLEKPDTQTTEAERDCLATYAAGRHRLVEIGVYEGVSTNVLASAMSPTGVLYAVDPFIPGRLGICWSELVARKMALRTRRDIVFVKLLSRNAAGAIDGDFDMIFIDADHSFDGMRQDWNDWSSRVGPSGIIALHDTRVPKHNPEVATFGSYKFFNQHIRDDPRFALVEQVDSLSVLKRHTRGQ
jgi:predicted O-methyltransferase YrrM